MWVTLIRALPSLMWVTLIRALLSLMWFTLIRAIGFRVQAPMSTYSLKPAPTLLRAIGLALLGYHCDLRRRAPKVDAAAPVVDAPAARGPSVGLGVATDAENPAKFNQQFAPRTECGVGCIVGMMRVRVEGGLEGILEVDLKSAARPAGATGDHLCPPRTVPPRRDHVPACASAHLSACGNRRCPPASRSSRLFSH